MSVVCVGGIRPNFIKLAPVLRELRRSRRLRGRLVHTGQHYDWAMSRRFFEELGLPEPEVNLGVGSGSQAVQVGETMMRLEEMLLKERPALVLVAGDGNPTLGAALAAAKVGVPVAHLEAGLRSYDWGMAEELNRRMVDHVSSLLLAPTEVAELNLLREGFQPDSIVRAGDTMVDVLRASRGRIAGSRVLEELGLEAGGYGVVTLHRAENVDDRRRLAGILRALGRVGLPLVFPVHPRTRARMEEFGLEGLVGAGRGLRLVEPLGYFDMMRLMRESRVVLTDSGGVQKEAFLLGVGCVTLRDSTEWVETVLLGGNVLAGSNPRRIGEAVRRVLRRRARRRGGRAGPYGGGGAAGRIVRDLERRYLEGRLVVPKVNFLKRGVPVPFAVALKGAELKRLHPKGLAYGGRRRLRSEEALVSGQRWLA